VSLALAVLLFAAQPVGGTSAVCLTGALSSVVVVLLPVALCVLAGTGVLSPGTLLSLAIAAAAVMLPGAGAAVLWASFFRGTPSSQSKTRGMAMTFALRIVSALCGAAFLSLLVASTGSHSLSPATSNVAAALWLLWVWLPFAAAVPLVLLVPSVVLAFSKSFVAAANSKSRGTPSPSPDSTSTSTSVATESTNSTRVPLLGGTKGLRVTATSYI
jgi:hypothetical protein